MERGADAQGPAALGPEKFVEQGDGPGGFGALDARIGNPEGAAISRGQTLAHIVDERRSPQLAHVLGDAHGLNVDAQLLHRRVVDG